MAKLLFMKYKLPNAIFDPVKTIYLLSFIIFIEFAHLEFSNMQWSSKCRLKKTRSYFQLNY